MIGKDRTITTRNESEAQRFQIYNRACDKRSDGCGMFF